MTVERPRCACKKEMQIVKFTGYYDSFKYWEFHEECICPNVYDVEDFEEDYEWHSSH